MTARTRAITAMAGVAAVFALALVPTSAMAAPTTHASASVVTYANCTALNKKYPHGVGKVGAHDKVSGKTKPVTNFYKNTSLYNANKKSDRDKDGIACEKH